MQTSIRNRDYRSQTQQFSDIYSLFKTICDDGNAMVPGLAIHNSLDGPGFDACLKCEAMNSGVDHPKNIANLGTGCNLSKISGQVNFVFCLNFF